MRTGHNAAWRFSVVLAVVLITFLLGALYRVRWGVKKPARTQATQISSTLPIATDPKVKAPEASSSPERASEPAAPATVLRDIEYSSGPNSSTVTVDVDDRVQYEINRLANPDRIYLDLQGSRIDPALSRKRFQITDPVLQAIRVAEHKGNVTRVTLETKRFCDYLLTTVRQSHQLQIQITQSGWAELSSRNDPDPAINPATR